MYVFDTDEVPAILKENKDVKHAEDMDIKTFFNLLRIIRSVKDVFKGNGEITLVYTGGNVPKFKIGAIVQNDDETKPARTKKLT